MSMLNCTKTTTVTPLERDAESGHEFLLVDQESMHRPLTEAYIARQYLNVHKARVTGFLPQILTMFHHGELQACVGLRPGSETPLFLESYLDRPIDQTIASVSLKPVNRNAIMEIGNLVATHRGGSLLLFLVMTAALDKAGFQWLAFTATPQVEKMINRLGFQPHHLAEATLDRLGDRADDWGTYYEVHPKVMTGYIPEAMAVLSQQPLTRKILEQQQVLIEALGLALKSARWN